MSEETIEFSAKYKNWVVIKKATIHEDTSPQEVAFALASIRQTLDRKGFEFLGFDMAALDAYAETITKGKAKRFGDLSEVIKALGSPEAKATVEKAMGTKEELKEIANTYLLRKVAQNLGFDLDLNQEMLSRAYEELKMPKQRGRKPKQ